MKLLIEQEDAQKILDYLLERPAKEVIGFIATLQRLEPEERKPAVIDMAEALEEA